jgi:hypothetical protein
MGLLNFLGEIVEKVGNESNYAYEKAKNMKPQSICSEIKRYSGGNIEDMLKVSGYSKALQEKCETMNKHELKRVFDMAYKDKNVYACKFMMPAMEKNGLAHYDNDGKMVKDYFF